MSQPNNSEIILVGLAWPRTFTHKHNPNPNTVIRKDATFRVEDILSGIAKSHGDSFKIVDVTFQLSIELHELILHDHSGLTTILKSTTQLRHILLTEKLVRAGTMP